MNDGCAGPLIKIVAIIIFGICLSYPFVTDNLFSFQPAPVKSLLNGLPFSVVLVDAVQNTMKAIPQFIVIVILMVICGWIGMLFWGRINYDLERRTAPSGAELCKLKPPRRDGTCPCCGSVLNVHHGGPGAAYYYAQVIKGPYIPEQSPFYFSCSNENCNYEWGA